MTTKQRHLALGQWTQKGHSCKYRAQGAFWRMVGIFCTRNQFWALQHCFFFKFVGFLQQHQF